MSKIGIFSGTFDPVHGGHIAFALAAAESVGLDKVYFLPEQMPRRKSGVTHYGHRIAMLKLALKPYQKLEVLELPDRQFSVTKTLPRLKKLWPDSQLHMLIGSDMLVLLASQEAKEQWPGYQTLLDSTKLIVGVRSNLEAKQASELLEKLQPESTVVETSRPHVSSQDIRRKLQSGQDHAELLSSIKSYIAKNWLYVSVSGA